MAVSLIVYPTADYNTFVSLSDANAIIDTTVNQSSWSALSDDDKSRYLISAFRNIMLLDNLVLPDAPTTCLEEAQSFMAIHDVVNNISAAKDSEGQIQSASVGSLSVTYVDGNPKETVTKYPKITRECLKDLGATFGGTRLLRA